MNNKLIGYDARITGAIAEKLWPKSRRDEYLLNPLIDFPRSCDPRAWPTIFRMYSDLKGVDRKNLSYGTFWFTFDSLLSCINNNKLLDKKYTFDIIAVTYDGEESAEELKKYSIDIIGNFEPIINEYNWELLGYEVTDCGFESANAGMGHCDIINNIPTFSPDRMEFSKYINKYNLFDSFEISEKFAIFEDERVPEHASFFSFSLWKLEVDGHPLKARMIGVKP